MFLISGVFRGPDFINEEQEIRDAIKIADKNRINGFFTSKRVLV
jgi:hypothetical protein